MLYGLNQSIPGGMFVHPGTRSGCSDATHHLAPVIPNRSGDPKLLLGSRTVVNGIRLTGDFLQMGGMVRRQTIFCRA